MSLWPFLERKVARKGSRVATHAEEETATRYVVGGLSYPKSRQLFEVIQAREVLARLPRISSGRAAHFLFSGSPLTNSLKEKGAQEVVVGYMGGARTGPGRTEGEFRFRGGMTALPLKDGVCEWVLLSAPAMPGTPIASLIHDLGRILVPGGGGILIDWHPYSAAALEALRGKAALNVSEGLGLERYFKAFRTAHLVVNQVREAFVDGALRKLLDTSEEREWFDTHKRQPFGIILFFQKLAS